MYISGLVSIIMPSYNTVEYIGESIESVIAQTYNKWELLIIDDCSTDNTIEVLSKYSGDSRIKFFINRVNLGAAESRNKGLREARGEWIAFLDSDDLWHKDKLAKQIKFMQDNEYKFSCTYSSYIDIKSNNINIVDESPQHIRKYMLYLCNWIGCLTVMYHQPTVGLIQIENLSKRNDYAMWLKVIKKVDCYCLNEILGYYRIRENSISHSSIIKLIYAHFYLFYKGERMNCLASAFLTNVNILMHIYRKFVYVKNIQ